MTYTIVCFHAHPDDEVLLMGGTMARLASEGHRVIVVTATTGERGLAAAGVTADRTLAEVRVDELKRSAALLGCARVVVLGYADSGSGSDAGSQNAFAAVPLDEPARRLCALLQDEHADVLTIYDPVGGYGHPDHVQVHRVGRRAAELAGTPVVLQVTVDRKALQRALRLVRWFAPRTPDFRAARFADSYTHPLDITHKVNVRGFLSQKRAAMLIHSSQATGDGPVRAMRWFTRLPWPLFRFAFGHEWFVEQGRRPRKRPLDDVLASLR
ncbi:MAG TPA: PIG-L family deacetylase [Acidothermaceae bacterium]